MYEGSSTFEDATTCATVTVDAEYDSSATDAAVSVSVTAESGCKYAIKTSSGMIYNADGSTTDINFVSGTDSQCGYLDGTAMSNDFSVMGMSGNFEVSVASASGTSQMYSSTSSVTDTNPSPTTTDTTETTTSETTDVDSAFSASIAFPASMVINAMTLFH